MNDVNQIETHEEDDLILVSDLKQPLEKQTNLNREHKMSKNYETKFIYNNTKNDSVVRVMMQNAGNMATLSREAVENYINEGVNYLKNNPDEEVWYSRSGDTVVLITRDDEEGEMLSVIVATPRLVGYTKGDC
jgi:predicted ATPase with chaperone activity